MGIKLIDFKNFENNSFYVIIELICKNGEEEFCLDIIIFINGMFLVFIEVKKLYNKEGVFVEWNCINKWFKNKCFCRFVNIM